jgi:hypothetical protein
MRMKYNQFKIREGRETKKPTTLFSYLTNIPCPLSLKTNPFKDTSNGK